jgi:hypothetical protein
MWEQFTGNVLRQVVNAVRSQLENIVVQGVYIRFFNLSIIY